MKNIPVLSVHKKTLAEAYEAALVELFKHGARLKTQYDKPDDPASLDATMNITVDEPLADPMIHKAFPGGMPDLREYVFELLGFKDSWTKKIGDKDDTRWEYTYHQRLANYGAFKSRNGVMDDIYDGISDPQDQFEIVVNKLAKQPFTRQAQMITWIPCLDTDCYDPPCLQSIWYRIMEEDDVQYLNYNIRFRSNDAWGAYMMNSFGLTMMIKKLVVNELIMKTGRDVRLGRMNWQADSWHVYGKDIKQCEERLMNRIPTTSFEDRVLNFGDEDIKEMYMESDDAILKKIEEMNAQMKKKDME